MRFQICFGLYFGESVAGIRSCGRRCVDGGVIAVAGIAESAQRTHKEQPARHHPLAGKRLAESAQIAEVYSVEIGEVCAFGGAEVVYHVVPRATLRRCFLKLGCQSVGGVVVEYGKIKAFVGEVAARCRLAHGHRDIISAPQSLGGDKAPDKASGTHYQ